MIGEFTVEILKKKDLFLNNFRKTKTDYTQPLYSDTRYSYQVHKRGNEDDFELRIDEIFKVTKLSSGEVAFIDRFEVYQPESYDFWIWYKFHLQDGTYEFTTRKKEVPAPVELQQLNKIHKCLEIL